MFRSNRFVFPFTKVSVNVKMKVFSTSNMVKDHWPRISCTAHFAGSPVGNVSYDRALTIFLVCCEGLPAFFIYLCWPLFCDSVLRISISENPCL